jgi:exodeoxyribonuclease-5
LPEALVYTSVLAAEEEERRLASPTNHLGEEGAAQVVVDWKTDVAPTPETLEHYRAQIRAYLDMSKRSGQ